MRTSLYESIGFQSHTSPWEQGGEAHSGYYVLRVAKGTVERPMALFCCASSGNDSKVQSRTADSRQLAVLQDPVTPTERNIPDMLSGAPRQFSKPAKSSKWPHTQISRFPSAIEDGGFDHSPLHARRRSKLGREPINLPGGRLARSAMPRQPTYCCTAAQRRYMPIPEVMATLGFATSTHHPWAFDWPCWRVSYGAIRQLVLGSPTSIWCRRNR